MFRLAVQTNWRQLTIAVLLWTVSGCAGPVAIRHSRQKYNEAIQFTANEQMLLNLVRLRYRETPSFMELTSLSTQFGFDKSASISGSFEENAKTTLGLASSIGASERPTITYGPLQGQGFVKRLISPIPEESIILLTRSGWRLDRVLRLTVQSLNGRENARSASGPTPDTAPEYKRFQDTLALLLRLMDQGLVRIGYDTKRNELSGEIDVNSISAQDIILAAKEGWKLQPRRESVQILTEQISSSQAAETYEDEELLKSIVQETKERGSVDPPVLVRWDADHKQFNVVEGDLRYLAARAAGLPRINCLLETSDKYILTGDKQSLVMRWKPGDISPELVEKTTEVLNLGTSESGEYELSLEPRSLLGVMYFLSQTIHVPLEHQEQGLVTVTVDNQNQVFDWAEATGRLIQIQCRKEKPNCAAVKVRHRGYWFYIGDTDLESKSTFSLLMQLFELQAGGGATGAAPVLTLPVGG